MKGRIHLLIPLLAGSMLTASVCQGAVVFSDDFSEASGTAIIGKSPDVGSAWTGVNNGTAVSAGNTLKTDGAGRTLFGGFTSALGTGQMLTLTYDTLTFGGGSFNGYAGVSLYSGGSGGNERVFTGDLGNANSWGVDGSALGNHPASPLDTTAVTSATFTYIYDSGAWTFTTTSGVNLSGTGTANAALNTLRVANGNGGDIEVDNLVVDISLVPVFSFVGQLPANGSYSASVTNTIRVQTTDGASPVNTNTIAMKVDGGTVTPSISKAANVTTISYDPVTPLSAGAMHTVVVTLAEDGGTAHTNTWSFTTGYPALPVTVAGPIATSNGTDVVLFNAAGNPWIGTNYNASSSKTLYVRHSMAFNNTAGEPDNGGGGCYGGIHFFDGNAERLLVGETWLRTTWSVDTKNGGGLAGEPELNPSTSVVSNEWHTMVTRVDYTPGGNATATIWLDPDFGLTEAEQPTPPLVVAINNTFDNIRFRCGNTPSSAQVSNIIVAATSSGVGFVAPASPQFQGFVPGVNASTVAPATPIAVEVLFGTYGISTNNVILTLDGTNVSPAFVVGTNSITVNYQPGGPFAPGSVHNVTIGVTDSNATFYSANWSFTVDTYPTLPLTLAESTNGTVDVFGGGLGTTIWTAQNGWIGGNYGTNSSNTLYARFTVNFQDLNNESGGGGGYGGLHFYLGGSERLIVGNNWPSTNWSLEATSPSLVQLDLLPVLPIVLGEWHTVVVKTEFVPGADDNIKIWLDPDFNVAEGSQPNAPLTFSTDNTFDNIHLRAGNGSAYAQYTNIVIGATAPDVGFPAVVPPAVLSIQKTGGNVEVSWTGPGTLQEATGVTGVWVDSAEQGNPQSRPATNATQFFRIKQ